MIRVEFLENVRCFKAGEIIVLDRNPTILVGDQGTGKSTLLELIAPFSTSILRHGWSKEVPKTIKLTVPENIIPLTHDFEKGNVRGSTAFGMGGIDDMGVELTMLHASHGQSSALATRYLYDKLATDLKKPENKGKNGFLALDEPDMGLSVRTAHTLGRSLRQIANMGHYILVSMHNPFAMSAATDMVYDVELRKYVKPKEFIDRMLDD